MIALLKTAIETRTAGGAIESYQVGAGDTAITYGSLEEMQLALRRLEADEAAYQRGGGFQTVRMSIARRGRMA
jgi:hypothetical protein